MQYPALGLIDFGPDDALGVKIASALVNRTRVAAGLTPLEDDEYLAGELSAIVASLRKQHVGDPQRALVVAEVDKDIAAAAVKLNLDVTQKVPVVETKK